MSKGVYDHYKIRGRTPSEETIRKRSLALTGHVVSIETRRKIGEANSRVLKGRKRTKESIEKTRLAHMGLSPSEETRKKISLAHVGMHPSKGTIEKVKQTMLKKWQDPAFRRKAVQAMFVSKFEPNKPEKLLIKLFNEILPNEYRYVGNGEVVVGRKIPDFININGQKKIIELFGDFWHSEKRTGRIKIEEENQRIDHFANYGYQTLIIWQSELKDLENLIRRLVSFHDSGIIRRKIIRRKCA